MVVNFARFISLVAVIFWSSTSFSSAQIQFGGKASLNLTSIGKQGEPFENAKLGWQVGVLGKKYLSDLGWFGMLELLYSKEGSDREELNYLILPFTVGFDFEETFNFQTGLQYGIVIGGASEAREYYKGNNLSANIGFEFYPLDQLIIGSRFNLGITNILDRPDLVGFSQAENNGFSLYFVYLFKR